MGRRLRWLQQDEGVTLVELIIGMVIVGLLFSAIGSALIVSLRTTGDTTAQFNRSHDAQITSAYLANDIQSAASVNKPSSVASCSGGSTTLVTFTYAAGPPQTATYACGFSGGETRVTRAFGGGSVVVAHFTGSSRPIVTCSPNADCSGSVDSVTIAFTEAPTGWGTYTYTLLGSRRTYNSDTSATPANVALWALAQSSPLWIAGGCPPGQTNPGNPNYDPTCDSDPSLGPSQGSKLTVNGNLYVNYDPAGSNIAVKISNKATLAVNNGVFKILQGGTCQGGGCNTNISCALCSPPNTYGSYSPALPDPLRFMAAPTASTSGSCSGSPVVCQPGVYASQLTINGVAKLRPGIYILQNGLSFGGSANVTVDNSAQSGGVLLYVQSGSLTFNGGSQINLTPYDQAPYQNILVFQARSNSSPLKLSGGTALNPASLVGIIYAPASTGVTLGAGGATMHVTAVVAQNIKITGTSQITIG